MADWYDLVCKKCDTKIQKTLNWITREVEIYCHKCKIYETVQQIHEGFSKHYKIKVKERNNNKTKKLELIDEGRK